MKNKKIKYLVLIAAVSLLFFTQINSVAATDPSDFGIWVDYDKGGYKVKNYYSYWSIPPYVVYVGQHHYEWRAVFIDNDNPTYDYYAVYVRQTLTPASAYGDSSNFKIIKGTTNIDLLTTGQMILDALPLRTSGSSTIGAGIGVSYDKSGPGGSFSASYSYSAPDVGIDPVTDAMDGGYTKWNFKMGIGAKKDQNTFYFTALIRVTEGYSLLIKIVLYTMWRLPLWGSREYTEYQYVSFDGTPSPPDDGGGGGGGGYIPAPPL